MKKTIPFKEFILTIDGEGSRYRMSVSDVGGDAESPTVTVQGSERRAIHKAKLAAAVIREKWGSVRVYRAFLAAAGYPVPASRNG